MTYAYYLAQINEMIHQGDWHAIIFCGAIVVVSLWALGKFVDRFIGK